MSLGRSKNMDEWKIKEGSFRKMKEIILWFVAITYPITLSPDYNYLLNQLEAMAYYVGGRGDIKLEKSDLFYFIDIFYYGTDFYCCEVLYLFNYTIIIILLPCIYLLVWDMFKPCDFY